MSVPIETAIVGAGWLGGRHADAIVGEGDRVTAVIDPDPARAHSLAERLGGGASTFVSLEDALSADRLFEAAVIATPSVLHLDQVERLLGARVPVLVEKPPWTPMQDPAHALGLGDDRVRCQVGMSTRFDPGIRKVASLAAQGAFGEILAINDRVWYQLDAATLPSWYFDPALSGGGILLTNGVHALDRARWILGGDDLAIEHVRAESVLDGHRCEDVVQLELRSSAGVAVTVSLLWASAAVGPSELSIIGTEGVGVVCSPGDWRVATPRLTTSGRTAPLEDLLRSQWRAFTGRDRGHGPDLAELQPTLRLIEAAYARLADV